MHGCEQNVNIKITSFIPKYVKIQQIELVEFSFFLLSVNPINQTC